MKQWFAKPNDADDLDPISLPCVQIIGDFFEIIELDTSSLKVGIDIRFILKTADTFKIADAGGFQENCERFGQGNRIPQINSFELELGVFLGSGHLQLEI